MTSQLSSATADRNIILNAPLCFMIGKHGRFAAKTLKSLVYDFFSGDIISSANDLLVSIINDLKITGAPVIPRRRRESKENIENRIKSDIDDIYSIILYLDEQKLCDKLPLFAVTDADLIPSPRMLEGDLHIVIDKLKNLEYKCSAMQLEIEKIAWFGYLISSHYSSNCHF